MADDPSPPRPTHPSGEPLPKDEDQPTDQARQSLAELFARSQSLAELRAQIHAQYPVTPPPSPIRRSYRSRQTATTSSCPNIPEIAQVIIFSYIHTHLSWNQGPLVSLGRGLGYSC